MFERTLRKGVSDGLRSGVSISVILSKNINTGGSSGTDRSGGDLRKPRLRNSKGQKPEGERLAGRLQGSLDDLLKAVVVVTGIKTGIGQLGLQPSADDAPRAAVSGTGSAYRVLAVVAP